MPFTTFRMFCAMNVDDQPGALLGLLGFWVVLTAGPKSRTDSLVLLKLLGFCLNY